MGYDERKLEDDNNSSSSSPLNEKLLIATMCIIGSQVHVHVKDGSVFSGLFYTASFDNGFGIVLKNAKMTKKGKSKANVASGSVVETLVITSSNIVQIVAEGVSLPSNVTGDNECGVVGSAMETLPSKPRLSTTKKSQKACVEVRGNHHRRQLGAKVFKRSEQHIPDVHQEDIQSSSSSLDSMSERVKPIAEDKLMPEPISNGFHNTTERPSSTDNSSTTVDETSDLRQGLEASPNESVPIQAVKKAKEFKLNPEAKTFSPSYTKRLSSSPAATPDIQNIAYIPSNTPMLPVPEPVYPQVGNNPYMSQTIPPSKFVPYGNLTAGNAVGEFHYPQHMMGPTVNMAQPQRFTSPYQSVQASPMFINPNPQVMVARSGQLVYVQPVSQNLVHGTPPLPPMLSRPLVPAQHVPYLKHQGVVAAGQPPQLCIPQPFTTGGLQPYSVVPAQFPVMQPPFPTNQPMHIAVPNGFFGTKFS
ncbi:unnamed protein product [Eruca vesicaria subsp. sativa]|uniref:Ataxin 2 SM domain-containing protein n=1 Tax=Eruca vesicaria subsp. sativa TaxID=29727 RepID=A0ABC8JPV9_ERUVS|nr:unnamed protein product [Eruca vesicaria subsp. sativa]